jgi:hypothetical protein
MLGRMSDTPKAISWEWWVHATVALRVLHGYMVHQNSFIGRSADDVQLQVEADARVLLI